MSNLVTVGIADMSIVQAPDALVTYALGSCVGVCLFDSAVQVGALLHIMLPSSLELSNIKNQPFKFADSGVDEMMAQMVRRGANPARMRAKIAGGAQMFAAISNSSIANIGTRNIVAVKNALAKHRIAIIAEDTGADYGRTLYFYPETGRVKVKSAKGGEREL